jgi:hypothetical protein
MGGPTIWERGLAAAALVAAVWLATAVGAAATPMPGPPPSTFTAPTVQFKALFVPLPGYPETGSIDGAGAAARVELTIAPGGSERLAPVLVVARLYLPAGTRVHVNGWSVCPEPQRSEPACPLRSQAGPPGQAIVSVGRTTDRLREGVALLPYFTSAGGLGLVLRSTATGTIALSATGSVAFDPEPVPAPVPAPDIGWLFSPGESLPYAALESASFVLGAARGPRTPAKATYYFNVPKACPLSGNLWRLVTIFAGSPGPGHEVETRYRSPCPRRARPRVIAPPPPPPPPCKSGRRFVIHIPRPHVPYRSVSVTLDGHPVPVKRGRTLTATIDLRGAPKGTHVVRITFVTRGGRRLVSTRTYRTCVPIGESG